MTKKGLIVFSIIAITCALLLSFISITSLYEGDDGELPGLLYILRNSSDGLVKDYKAFLGSAIDMPHYDILDIFLYKFLLAIILLICGLLLFIFVGGAPLMLIGSAILLVSHLSKKLNFSSQENYLLSISAILLILSQTYHIFYSFIGLEHKNTAFLRIILLIVLFICFIAISECTGASPQERKISLFNKGMKLLFSGSVFVVMYILSNYVPQTLAMRMLFAFSLTQILSFSFSSSICLVEVRGVTFLTLNVLLSQIFFVVAALLHNEIEITGIIILLICDVLLFAISEFFVYKFYLYTAKHPRFPEKILAGNCTGKRLMEDNDFITGIPSGAYRFFARSLLAVAILMGGSIALSFIINFLMIEVFGANIAVASVIRIIAISIASIIYIYNLCSYTSGFFEDLYVYDYVRKVWKNRNSSVCLSFSCITCVGISALAVAAIFLFDLSFNLTKQSSVITYAIIPGVIYIIILFVQIISTLSYSACSGCGYINTASVTSTDTKTFIKKHVEEVKGHYVTDTTTAKTEEQTTGSIDTDHYYGGNLLGRSYGTARYNTSSTTTYETKRWVEGYAVDKGNYKHTVETSKHVCRCCGYKYTGRYEISKFIGY